MRRFFAAWLVASIALAGAASASCISFEAIGSGGAPERELPNLDFSGPGQSTSLSVGSGVAPPDPPSVVPTPPCGLFYDWDSCTVDDLTALPVSLEEASPLFAGAWRRCNEDGTGLFPVGVFFADDGAVFRMHRMPNPFAEGTKHLLFCGEEPEDQGTWTLEEGAEGIRLVLEWDDETVDDVGVVLYASQPAWGAVHGPTDTEGGTERFITEAPSVPGSLP